MKRGPALFVIPAQDGNPEQIERLFPRLPGESYPGVFELSGPGNDGGTGPP
ncbi:MAG: hypothetical protein R6V55_01780 [Desulfovermiculus sp.]